MIIFNSLIGALGASSALHIELLQILLLEGRILHFLLIEFALLQGSSENFRTPHSTRY